MASKETLAKRQAAYEKIFNGAEEITYSDCVQAIAYDETIIAKIPEAQLSDALLENCVKKKGSRLQHIPEHRRSEGICVIAVSSSPKTLKYVPRDLRGIVLFKVFIQGKLPSTIPSGYQTIEYYYELLSLTKFSKQFIQWLEGVETKYSKTEYDIYQALSFFARVYLSDEKYDQKTIDRERVLSLRTTSKTFFDNDTQYFSVIEKHYGRTEVFKTRSFEEFYHYLGGNLNNANLTEYDFANIDTALYNMRGAYLNSKLLIEQGTYCNEYYLSTIGRHFDKCSWMPALRQETTEARLITHIDEYSDKLNPCDRSIYYVTDIHLNYQLAEKFPNFATYEEVYFFIQKYVRKLLSSVCEKKYSDYLLIGGDVSFSFEFSKMFYRELRHQWGSSRIIAILGNHELWNVDYVMADKKLENTIKQYHDLFDELKITFLQNSLFVEKQFSSYVLSEHDILTKTDDDLLDFLLDSSLIIYGGIGFSAYNQAFNATHGIYGDTISSLQCDLEQTQRSERIYSKLSNALSKEKMIVLSHMPLEDWAKCTRNPNWIYIHGHTHNNYYVQSDACTIYADNQMGYKSTSIGLKYFKIKIYYDIFRYYSDGIYCITKEQYLNFNAGNGTRCTFNRIVSDIIMLKRDGIYLFLLEEKEQNKLYLLNGGVLNRLKNTDVNYYYSNMVQYSTYIKAVIRKYNDALKNISNFIKAIGGAGTVHGCIVDIDYYNHIHLDPNDGTITAYFSPEYGFQYKYSTIERLLESKCPEIYSNFKRLRDQSKDLVQMTDIDVLSSEETFVHETAQYKPSLLVKRIQYLTENNVIRIWSDDLLLKHKQQITGNKLQV